MAIYHFFKYSIFTFSLLFFTFSAEAVLTEPTKDGPKDFKKISSPRSLERGPTGFYYEEKKDKAQAVEKEFNERNKSHSKTTIFVKFIPRDETTEDKGQDSRKRKRDFHERNPSSTKGKTFAKFTARPNSDDEEEEGDEVTNSTKRGLRRSKRVKLEKKSTSDSEKEEKVLGKKDGRKRIKTPWNYPHSVHGHMRIKIGNRTYMGSGTMIDETHVLTAGHNLFFRQYNSAPDKITFFPGLHGDKARWTANAVSWVTHPKYVDPKTKGQEIKNHDIGIVTLDQPVGKETGYMDLDKMEKKKLQQAQLTVKGYPGDLGNGSFMYSMNGPVLSVEKEQIAYKIDTAPGQSGSGVFDEETSTIRGVHTYGGTKATGNKGTRINEKFRKLIGKWKIV